MTTGIDFMSSRVDVDPQTAACARLISAVIGMAIRDACDDISPDEAFRCRNLREDAASAAKYLFSDLSDFVDHAALIGLNAGDIRQALRDTPAHEYPADRQSARENWDGPFVYNSRRRRNLRARARWVK